MRKKKLFVALMALSYNVFAQDLSISTSIEDIKFYNLDSLKKDRYSLRYIGDNIEDRYFFYESLKDRKKKILQLKNSSFIDVSSTYHFAVRKYLSNRLIYDDLFFYSVDYLNDPNDYGYSKLYIRALNKDYYLDSIYNVDKKIHASFSSDGRYLLINTFNTLLDYYNPEQDNITRVYDLSELAQGKITTAHFSCQHCSDSYLVNDQLFFTVGRQDGYDNYELKDIYLAPWGSLKDSVKVASNTDIRAISADGKYILGNRFFDKQQPTDVIVDVAHRRFQLLLGRNYPKQQAFYSRYEGKFTYDFDTHLIYVDYPKDYPFDALKWRNEEIPDWTNEAFWQQYEHPPLD